MGQRAEAKLIYGLSLGEETPWYDWEDDDSCEDWEDALLEKGGVQDRPYEVRKAYLETTMNGCTIEMHCTYDDSMYIVAIDGARYCVEWGGDKLITPERMAVKPEWKGMLKAFCEKLDINFDAYEKTLGWHLVAMFG